MMKEIRYKRLSSMFKKRTGSRKHQGRMTTWFANQSKFLRYAIVSILIAGITTSVIGALFLTGVIDLSIAPSSPASNHLSISVFDGHLNAELDTSSFSYDLYGTNTSSVNDLDILKSGNDIGSISSSDMISPSSGNHYNIFWLEYNGTQPHDDDIYGESNDRGARMYGERWAWINATGPNKLTTYETPNVVVMHVFNAETNAILTTPLNNQVIIGTNITLWIGMNASQPEAMYAPCYSPLLGDDIQVHFVITFDNTPVKTDFTVKDANEHVLSSSIFGNSITCDVGYLAKIANYSKIIWIGDWIGQTVAGAETKISSISVTWGTTILDTI